MNSRVEEKRARSRNTSMKFQFQFGMLSKICAALYSEAWTVLLALSWSSRSLVITAPLRKGDQQVFCLHIEAADLHGSEGRQTLGKTQVTKSADLTMRAELQ